MATPANIQELALAIGIKKQADLVTPLVAGDMWSLSQTNRSVAQPLYNVETNAADIGKGDEWPTQTYPSHIDTPFPWDARLSSENAAMLMVFGLGKSTKAVAGDGFSYTCTPLDPVADTINLPATTVVAAARQGASDIFDSALLGMVLDEWAINMTFGPGRDNATLTSRWLGTGKNVSPSTITVPVMTTEHMLNSGGSTIITIRGNDYIAAQTFVSAEFGWRNNLRDAFGFYPGSGTQNGFSIRNRMWHGQREAFLRFTAIFQNGSPELTDFLAQTEGTAQIHIQGAVLGASYHSLDVTWHRIVHRGVVIGETENLITVAVECQIMKHSSNGVLTAVAITDTDNIGIAAT